MEAYRTLDLHNFELDLHNFIQNYDQVVQLNFSPINIIQLHNQMQYKNLD
jgi:hypothetical protein